MPANTAHGYPYPVGTDRVMDGDDSIHSLATAIDTKLAGGVASGQGTALAVAQGATVPAAIVFPAGLFTQAPNCMAIPNGSNPANFAVTISASPAPTKDGMTVNAYRAAGATGNITFFWMAHQQA